MNMRFIPFQAWVILALLAATPRVWTQVLTFNPEIHYTLQTGSQLLRGCPLCDRIPHPVPMTGTFQLVPVEIGPFMTRYDMHDIQFLAKDDTAKYTVTGSGTYAITGEFALTQSCSLSMDIFSATDVVSCEATNSDILIKAIWPQIQTLVIQSNGTPAVTYELTILAAPVPQITQLSIDTVSGDITVSWTASGPAQLERAPTVEGPFTGVSPVTKDTSFVDAGAFKKERNLFYRLRVE
jgi:hypothetical protein